MTLYLARRTLSIPALPLTAHLTSQSEEDIRGRRKKSRKKTFRKTQALTDTLTLDDRRADGGAAPDAATTDESASRSNSERKAADSDGDSSGSAADDDGGAGGGDGGGGGGGGGSGVASGVGAGFSALQSLVARCHDALGVQSRARYLFAIAPLVVVPRPQRHAAPVSLSPRPLPRPSLHLCD